jgi:hypothetical protein
MIVCIYEQEPRLVAAKSTKLGFSLLVVSPILLLMCKTSAFYAILLFPSPIQIAFLSLCLRLCNIGLGRIADSVLALSNAAIQDGQRM